MCRTCFTVATPNAKGTNTRDKLKAWFVVLLVDTALLILEGNCFAVLQLFCKTEKKENENIQF